VYPIYCFFTCIPFIHWSSVCSVKFHVNYSRKYQMIRKGTYFRLDSVLT